MSVSPSTVKDIRNGLLIGAVALAVLLPLAHVVQQRSATTPVTAQTAAANVMRLPPVPDFGAIQPTSNARELVEWIARTGDNQNMPFVLVDKQAARLHVFNAASQLEDSTPILLGSAPGDDTVPGIGSRPVHLVKPHERTTPAGRFVGQLGHNLTGEDVVWVDYDAAVSMHRVRPTLQPKERRAERLASDTIEDNRISYGCINVPAAFYEARLQPVFTQMQAVVYVLPEHKSLQAVFGLPAPAEQGAQRVRRSAGFV
ncbi:hypothetical protein [Hydrogenophaga sp.]|uniref:hypothetical protein n=1 Tax=Hydrogenophaga sp. TaxID=1904254 RepID=UPI002725569D|nr:hypothetical protein [Hydrogenophaga sp.]MDO9434414.1 hypothetical protein [Hydrogenophaga sp.]